MIVVLLGGGTAFAYFRYFNSALTPNQVLQKMYAAAAAVKTVSFSGDVTSTIYIPTSSLQFGGFSDSPASASPTSTSYDVSFDGDSDISNPTNIAQSSTITISGGFDGQNFTATGEFISLNKIYYVKLDNLNFGTSTAPNPMTSLFSIFTGQWFEIDPAAVEQEFMGSSTAQISQIQSSTQLTAQDIQEIRNDAMQDQIISVSQVLPEEAIGGQENYHYKLAVNVDNLKNFITATVGIISGNSSSSLSTDQLQAMEDNLDELQFNDLEIWIGTNDFLPHEISANIGESLASQTIGSFTMNVQSNFNQPVTITAPTGAKDINTILQGLMGSASFGSPVSTAEQSAEVNDSNRISDISVLKSAVAYYLVSTAGPYTFCKAGKVYASNEGTTAVNGTGWIPIDLDALKNGPPLGALPIDPINSGQYIYTFQCDPSNLTFKFTAAMQSQKYGRGGQTDVESTDGGTNPNLYEQGTNLEL